jgi:hypothetical protein
LRQEEELTQRKREITALEQKNFGLGKDLERIQGENN